MIYILIAASIILTFYVTIMPTSLYQLSTFYIEAPLLSLIVGIPATLIALGIALFLLYEDEACFEYLKNIWRIFSRGGRKN